MNPKNVNYRNSQIKAILAHVFASQDGSLQNLIAKQGLKRGSPHFEDIFNVTTDDILEYVKTHGWDSRVVRNIDLLPADPEHISWDWRFFLLPATGGVWRCGRRFDTERRTNPYEIWSFENELAMERHIAADLIQERRELMAPRQTIKVETQ